MLRVEHVYKKYKGAKDFAIKDIDFIVPDGKVLGLLGKNGVGKSTTIKSICGIFPFDKGKITINGRDIQKEPEAAKQIIGYSPDDHSIFEKLAGGECLNYIGSLYGMDKEKKEKRVMHLAQTFEIDYALDKRISSYSHGMKQKICLCASLIHQPKLWVLDEPMLGLDPQTKETVMKYIKYYASLGNSVLFSNHDIYTVSKVCDYIVIVNKGVIVDKINMKHTKYNTPEKLEKHFMALTKK